MNIHHTPTPRRTAALIVAALAFGLLAPVTFAQHVRDGGKFFSASAVQRAEADLAALQNGGGRNVVIETYDSAPAGVNANDPAGHDAAFGPFVRMRGSEMRADVYVLVNRNPSHLRVWPNPNAKGVSDSTRQSMADTLLRSFKARDFDGGLTAFVSAVRAAPAGGASTAAPPVRPSADVPQGRTNQSQPPAPQNGPAGQPTEVKKSTGLLSGGCFPFVLLAIGAVILFSVLKMFRRRSAGPPAMPYGQGGQPGYGQPGYGQPGYGNQGGGGGGMGGFGAGVGGGLLGGVLGSVIGNKVFGQGQSGTPADPSASGGAAGAGDNMQYNDPSPGADSSSYSDSSGGDFGSSDSGGDGGDSSGGDF